MDYGFSAQFSIPMRQVVYMTPHAPVRPHATTHASSGRHETAMRQVLSLSSMFLLGDGVSSNVPFVDSNLQAGH